MRRKDCIYKVTLEEEKVFKTKIEEDPTEVRIVAVKGDKGDPGDPGEPGPANTLSIGTVTTGETASATITGDAPNQTLNLVMPEPGNVTAGNGINITDGEISIDPNVVAEVSDIGNATLTIQRNGTTAQTFTANSKTNKSVDIQAPVRVDLRGQVQVSAYTRSVIALCKVSEVPHVTLNSYSSGRLTFHRDNGNSPVDYIDFVIENQYENNVTTNFGYSSNMDLLKINGPGGTSTQIGFRPITFRYNNEWYGGIEYFGSNANHQYVSFFGETNFQIFGVDYYKVAYTSGGVSHPAEILNQEIYDTFNETGGHFTSGTLNALHLGTAERTIWSGDLEHKNFAYLPAKDGTLAMTSDNVASATKLETAHTIGINTGAWGTPTAFDGSSDITIPITDIKESYIVWGGKNTIDNNVPPATMGCLDEFGHNKFSYLPGECMTVAFTRDGGTTWLDYTTANGADFTAGNEHKIRFMTYGNSYFNLGGRSTNDVNPENDQLRIRISAWSDTSTPKLYVQFKQLAINMSTQGASGTKVRIRVRTIQNWIDGVETWVDKGTYDLAGWSGWNTMPFDQRFGGSTTQKNQMGEIEFLFTQTDVSSSTRRNSQIVALRGIASNTWASPSELASSGRLYTIDSNQTATFPGEVVANRIYPNADNTYNLGASGRKWKHLYLAGSLINASGDVIALPSSSGTLALTSDIQSAMIIREWS